MTVGDELRDARIGRQLSIEQLSARTKITAPVLRAIESNDIAKLPAPIFTRGFLRAYAQEVGMDPQSVAARFFAQFEPSSEDQVTPEPEGAAGRVFAGRRDPWVPDMNADGARAWVPAAAMAAVLVLLLYFTADVRNGREAPSQSGVASAPIESSNAGAGPRPADGQREVTSPQAAVATAGDAAVPAATGEAAPLQVQLQARGLVWVTASADGSRVAYRLMQPGDRQTIDASREVVVRAGDAGNLIVSINGAPGAPLGAPGQVLTTRFTPPLTP